MHLDCFIRHFWIGAVAMAMTVAGCGPDARSRECVGLIVDVLTDETNCGRCGNVCSDGYSCYDGSCIAGSCKPGVVEECYSGFEGTKDVGPCRGGERTCLEGGLWSPCEGQVIPVHEDCSDGVDNNCNGELDESSDYDGDGFTTCAGDCCDSTECTAPGLANPGAFDAAANGFDDDCNGVTDDTAALCDQTLASSSTDALDFAKAIDLCQTATEKKWGVISATLTLADGNGVPDPNGHSIRHKFGARAVPQGGVSLAVLSTGAAAAKNDVAPNFREFSGYSHISPTGTSPFPPDFLVANGGMLPNAPGCPPPSSTSARDPVMLTLKIRVPTNARSFKLSSNFFSAEFPEYTCSRYNDFFVILLDSNYAGDPPNPTDKNLAFYQPPNSTMKYPVGVNLGHGNTGLFSQCMNGETGCLGKPGNITTCTSTTMLDNTGFDDEDPYSCEQNSIVGGATGWLVTSGNVTPGEIMTLRIAIWDTSDQQLDSLALIDGFLWSTEIAQPGTDIF